MPNLYDHSEGYYSFTPAEVAAICAAGEGVTYEAGAFVMEKGQVGDSMYILMEGAVELDLGFRERFALRRPGDHFGELSFVHPGHRRSAAVRAIEPTLLYRLDQRAIDPLYGAHPGALLKLLRRACALVIDSEERLVGSLVQKNEELRRSYDYLRRTRAELDYQGLLAQTDALTGLYNRRCLEEQLARGLEECAKGGRGLGLLMLDLDGFKPVNDRLGHPVGDEVLRLVAETIRECVRADDLPCRYGGDEFAVLLQGVELGFATERAEQLRERIAALAPIRPGAPRVTASIGGTVVRPGDTPTSLVRRADGRLYAAKSAGRNRVSWDSGEEGSAPAPIGT
jgi:diguanylate cyclase (GGDEF)-like protein